MKKKRYLDIIGSKIIVVFFGFYVNEYCKNIIWKVYFFLNLSLIYVYRYNGVF